MQIDHIFIFSNNTGKEAQELLDFGFLEGSSRVHKGQGTTNRKFYFKNFFLEILWVSDLQEIKSNLITPTKLWERADFKKNNFSPFGLCLVNTDSTNALFANENINIIKYQPQYFPVGMEIEILTNEHLPHLPWTFRLPFKSEIETEIKENKHQNEPTTHQNGIKNLTEASFGIPFFKGAVNFQNEETIKFVKNNIIQAYTLTLTFDNHQQGKTKIFSEIPLLIKY